MIDDGPLALPADLARRVSEERYAALLGYPPGTPPAGRAVALTRSSREWFDRNATPWACARTVRIASLTPERVEVESGPSFISTVLAGRLIEIDARRLVVAAVSAGPEVDEASARHWSEDRPDEAYFLDRFGAATAVHLGAWVGERLRNLAAGAGLGLGPGYSPGYDGWSLADQVVVAECLPEAPGHLRVLESGMIEPKNSLIAVFGLGERLEAVEEQWRRHGCSWCSRAACGLRGRLYSAHGSRP